MSKLAQLFLKISSIVLVFAASPIHILVNYSAKETELVQIETGGLNPFWTFVIFVLVGVLIIWVITSLLVMWWEKIKKKPFGNISVLTFGIILVMLLGSGIAMLGSLSNLIDINAEMLLDNFAIYIKDFQIMLGYVVIGTLLNAVLIFWK